MPATLPKIALASLPAPPPTGSIQFFDGYFPALTAGTYNISVTHTVTGNAGAPPAFSVTQSVEVQAPEFTIDTTLVQTVYPPNGGSDIYDQTLPFLILGDPALPWERSLTPGSDMPDPANPTAWMALLIFAEGEIYLQPGSNNPVVTTTVSDLLATNANVLKPQLPTGWVSQAVLSSQCQTITIPGAVFNAVVPTTADLPYLTHCRGVNTLDEGELLLSVFLSNRLAVANTLVTPAAAVRYFAHLVSLEGFAAYMGPNATPIPVKPGSTDLQDVQMASLFNWSFTSQPEQDLSFSALMGGLIASEQATPTLNLPLPQGNPLPVNVQNRLQEGYAPLEFVSGAGEDTFAWYRGPFSATVPQPLPQVGGSPLPVSQATSADELMIYLAEQGLFDLSYAAAWNIGRNLALADASFAQNVSTYRQAAANQFATLAQRRAMPHHFGLASPKTLLARNPTRDRFAQLVAEGMGRQWTHALNGVRQNRPLLKTKSRPSRHARLRAPMRSSLASALAQPQAVEAVGTNLNDIIESVAAWLAKLSLLYPVPFSYLVPDPRMLPVESIRFFYVDPNWIQALNAGALSIAIHSSQDAAIHAVMLPRLHLAAEQHRRRIFRRTRPDSVPNSGIGGNVTLSGMLIRSQVVSGWPALVISPTLGGAPLNIVRNDCPAPTVRLCLFDGIPDTVSLAEPYQGVLFGIEDKGIYPRCVTSPAFTGSQIANGTPLQPTLRTPPSGALGGVLQVQATAAALEPAVGIAAFASNAVVQWNGTALQTTWVSAIQLTAAVPANLIATPGSAQVTVASGGATSLPAIFTIDAPLEIDSINPAMVQLGGPDFKLVVNGVGFAAAAVVQWSGSPLSTTIVSANEATAAVPKSLIASAGSATITVLSNGATSNGVTLNIVTADPSIDSIEPNILMAGGAGFALTVAGSGFASGDAVNWNGSPLVTSFSSDQLLKAAVPASLIATAGSAQVTVSYQGAVSNAVPFTIATANPSIGSLKPSVALAGAGSFSLVVDGVNFATGAVVQWNSTPLTPTSSGADQLVVTVPASLVTAAQNASITVLSGGVTSNALPFTVVGPQPAVGLLEPPSIIAGSAAFTLTVTGGFGAGDFALQMVAAPELQSFPTT